MTNLIAGINSFFTNVLWTQLGNFTNWLVNDVIGQVIIAIIILLILGDVVIRIITLRSKKGDN